MTISDAKFQLREDEKALLSARFVQQGLLPKERHFKRLFTDHFVFYAPQRIISGDFYWVGQKHGLKYVVVGDCTGHGVSAALLSVLGLNLLEHVIMNKSIKKVSKILKEFDNKFIESFKGAELLNFDNPWIDLSIICIDEVRKTVHYSTANRKILHINHEGKPEILRGVPYPIGGWQVANCRSFEAHMIQYEEGDSLFLGSDGFQDQIGGPRNKKYTSKRLHEFLAEKSKLPMHFQKEELALEFVKWKGNEPQLDDVCIVGLKL